MTVNFQAQRFLRISEAAVCGTWWFESVATWNGTFMLRFGGVVSRAGQLVYHRTASTLYSLMFMGFHKASF